MVEWIKVVLLGILEGITEFLPISSTGHLILATKSLQLHASLSLTFEIFIQLGAVIAVVAYYRKELWQQVKKAPHDPDVRRFWRGIILAFLPAAALGFFLADAMEEYLFRPETVAAALIMGGLMFIILEGSSIAEAQPEKTIEDEPLTLRQAFIVGLWQVLALVPGMSRSGMSIIGGIRAGLDRHRATQFSFYLAIPTLGTATIFTLLKNLDQITMNDLWLLGLGTLVSGLVAWVSIDWLLRYVARNTFIVFGYYRIIIGLIILLLKAII